MKKSIYDISEDYMEVLHEIEDNDGMLNEELEERLKIAEDELEEKLRAYRHIIKTNETFVRMNKDEVVRLRDRNKSFDNTKDRLVSHIIPALHMFGNRTATGNYNLKFSDFSVSTRVNKSISLNSDKVQSLLEAMIHPDITVDDRLTPYGIIGRTKSILNRLGDVEVTIKVPFNDLYKYRKDLSEDSTNGVVWNIAKANLKDLIEERDNLYELINNNCATMEEIEKHNEITTLLNYLEVNIEEKETVNFR